MECAWTNVLSLCISCIYYNLYHVATQRIIRFQDFIWAWEEKAIRWCHVSHTHLRPGASSYTGAFYQQTSIVIWGAINADNQAVLGYSLSGFLCLCFSLWNAKVQEMLVARQPSHDWISSPNALQLYPICLTGQHLCIVLLVVVFPC